MLKSQIRQILLSLFLIACFVQQVNGQTISMPNIIGNNMVLQQNTHVPVWGWATAGTSITVTASWGETVTTIAATTGKWMTKIQTPVAIPGQAPSYTLTITGPVNTITYSNILVGEVWLCSGQSNMWFQMKYTDSYLQGVVDSQNEIAAANYPNIRLFTVQKATATTPATNCSGSWSSCSPSTVATFSAAAYYFGRELYNNAAVNVPIGLIHSSYGGSAIQTWVKDSVLQSDADLKKLYIDKTYTSDVSKPSLLYNAMIAPIIPFAIKGTIWYQGESNTWDGPTYTKANIALINDWRKDWGTEFSFYAVQLTPYLTSAQTKDVNYNRALFREYQSNITVLPKTGIVATCDLLISKEEVAVVHPQNKKDVGTRLALWALAKDYGQNIQYIGPTYQSSATEGNKVRINFKPESLGGGLISKDGKDLTGFKIAGADKLFYSAPAIIDGNSIVVSSPSVNTPVAVRFAFTEGGMTNLINTERVAAFPFRTDSWTSATNVELPEGVLNETFENFAVTATPTTTVSTSGFSWSVLGSTIQIVDNPAKSGINSSNKVLFISRNSIDTISTNISASGFAYRGVSTISFSLPLTATDCIIEAKVLKTVSGKVGIRLYPSSGINVYTIVTADLQGSPDWQTVQFNFSALASTMTVSPKLNFEVEKTLTPAGQNGALSVWIDDIKLVSNSAAGINDISEQNQVISYIDSSDSFLKLQNLPAGPCTIELTNLSGIVCQKSKTSSINASIDVSALCSGIYLVSCYSNIRKSYIGKVIKR